MLKLTIVVGGVLIFLSISNPGKAHESLPTNNHPHTAENVLWDPDGSKDGSVSHNHHAARSFRGPSQSDKEPYAAHSCWDDREWRGSQSFNFRNGHCYIKESNSNSVVRYAFESSAMPVEAKNLVRDAFAAWSAVTPAPNLKLGIEFVEVTHPGNHEVTVKWESLNDAEHNGGYITLNEPVQLVFDSEFNGTLEWYYGKSKNNVPANRMHFYTIVLHEVGHIVGLEHQNDPTGDLMFAPVGVPNGPFFDEIGVNEIEGVRDLYSQPPAAPITSLNISLINGNCLYPEFSVTITTNLPADECEINNVNESGTVIFSTLYAGSGPTCLPTTDEGYYQAQCSNDGDDGPLSSIRLASPGNCNPNW